MARARNIKPGFFKNEDLAECSSWARLCFAGLWTLADREGRLEDRPKRIKGELFPYDTVDVEPLLQELGRFNFILRYEIDGFKAIQILEFTKHQSPHYTESKSVIKPPKLPESCGHHEDDNPGGLLEDSENLPGIKRGSLPPDSLIPDSLIHNPPIAPPRGTVAADKSRRSRKTPMPEGFCVSDRVRKWAADHGHGGLDAHLAHFVGYARANGKTYADWDQALMNAIRDDWAKVGPSPGMKARAGWWTAAGFPDLFQAESAGCTERNVHCWRDGKRLEAAT